ncbi:hypothetical protein D3C81_1062650 [compost metagenome]
MYLRQDLEAPVEQQPGLGVTGLDGLDHAHHAGFLPGALGIGLGYQVIGVERIEEEAAIAALPQRGDDLVHIECRPAVGGLVNHACLPGVIAADQPIFGDVLEVGPAGQHLAQADVGEPRCLRRGGAARIEAAVGLHHGHVEGLQGIHGRLAAIVEGDVGRCRLGQIGRRLGLNRRRRRQRGKHHAERGRQYRHDRHGALPCGGGPRRRLAGIAGIAEKSPD